MKKFMFFMLLFLFTQSSCFAMAENSAQLSGVAPDFTLETIAGKTVSLKDYRGKGVILFFFTTSCPYCREKVPQLSRDYEKYKSENVELLAINSGDSQRKVSSFAAKEGVSFDILLDSNLKAADSYSIVGVPTFVLVDKDGKIVYNDNAFPSDYVKMLSK